MAITRIIIPSEFQIPITVTDLHNNLVSIDSLANLVVWLSCDKEHYAKYSITPLVDHQELIRDDATHYHINFKSTDQQYVDYDGKTKMWKRGYLQIGIKYSVEDNSFDSVTDVFDTFAWLDSNILMDSKPISKLNEPFNN